VDAVAVARGEAAAQQQVIGPVQKWQRIAADGGQVRGVSRRVRDVREHVYTQQEQALAAGSGIVHAHRLLHDGQRARDARRALGLREQRLVEAAAARADLQVGAPREVFHGPGGSAQHRVVHDHHRDQHRHAERDAEHGQAGAQRVLAQAR
jgi:hypothetical protein